MRKLSYALLMSALLALPVHAEWNKMDGQPVPVISGDAWLNLGKEKPPTTKTLKGKVYLLEFFATW